MIYLINQQLLINGSAPEVGEVISQMAKLMMIRHWNAVIMLVLDFCLGIRVP